MKRSAGGIEQVISSQPVYHGRIVNLRVDTVALPNGGTSSREIVEHREGVVIVALDDGGNVLLVRQYRLPIRDFLLELPAGGVDDGETPQEAAQRELQEETGYRASALHRLGGFYVAPGYCNEYIHVFKAADLEVSPRDADADEDLELVRMSWEKVLGMAQRGEFTDGKSIIGILIAK